MSVILHFPKQPKLRSQSEPENRETSAEILFFTGVRFERHYEDDHQVTRPQRGGSSTGKRRRKA
jgi:hypothetical protein